MPLHMDLQSPPESGLLQKICPSTKDLMDVWGLQSLFHSQSNPLNAEGQ